MDGRFVIPTRPHPLDSYHWWLHELFIVLAVVALVVGAVLIVRLFLNRPHRWPGPPPRNPAIDELDLRYARGEMSRADYLERRADLLGYSPTASASPGSGAGAIPSGPGAPPGATTSGSGTSSP